MINESLNLPGQAFDLKLLEFEKRQSERAVDFVKNLYANVSLSRSAAQQIISMITDYQKTSITYLKTIDPQTFANKKLDIALKFLQNSFSGVKTEQKVLTCLEKKNALIRPIARVIDRQIKPRLIKKLGKTVCIPINTQIYTVPMARVLKNYLE